MSIEIRKVSKKFGDFAALNEVSLEVGDGELVALLGPSGSGKTTLLRVIAGLEAADSGQVLFQGEDSNDRHVRDRRVGFVFQHYALFRHMTIFENVAFGLRVRPRKLRLPEKDIRARVGKLLELVQLDWLADRYPHQLSGGQRQRIALARALAVEPRVLLLDEPFGALDAKVRKELRRWLRRLHDDMHITSVFVTHDQEEAMEVADRVVVMNRGKVEQVGAPDEVYEHPATPFVYEFLGDVNLFHGRLPAAWEQLHGQPVTPSGALGRAAYVRPHEIEVTRAPQGETSVAARVDQVLRLGSAVRLELSTADRAELIEVELSKERQQQLGLARGDTVYIRPTSVRVFERKLEKIG